MSKKMLVKYDHIEAITNKYLKIMNSYQAIKDAIAEHKSTVDNTYAIKLHGEQYANYTNNSTEFYIKYNFLKN